MVLMEGMLVNTSERAIFYDSESFCSLLLFKRDRRAATPPYFSPNVSDKNFEIAILLKIVKRSDNRNYQITDENN